MFTMKHVTAVDTEELHMGTSPMFVSAASVEGQERGNAVFHYTDAKGEIQTLRYGKVYVMNDMAKTVATYDMGYPSIGAGNQSGNYQSPLGRQTPL